MDFRPFIDQIRNICREYNVAMLGVFGSVARGEETAASDIDLLVTLARPIGLIELIKLEDKFDGVLGRKVDLATDGSLHPLIRQNVQSELKVIYEK